MKGREGGLINPIGLLLLRELQVVFIAAGEAKAEKVRLILEGHSEAATLPAARVKSQADEATWVLDGPAASQLTISASSSLHSVEL